MSSAGNRYLQTPAIDSLAATGVRFDRTYCTNPVCVPSRFSLMTGLMPSEIALRSNATSHISGIPDAITQRGIGRLFRDAGYDVAYGGKNHLPKMDPEDLGFESITNDYRDSLAPLCAKYIKQSRQKPFFLVASFINPHDICYMGVRDFAETDTENRCLRNAEVELATLDEALRLPENVARGDFFKHYCPPLPSNFEPQQDEPEVLGTLMPEWPCRMKCRQQWSEERWRLYRWAYCKLTEMVDTQIARICDAVRQSGKEENTVVIFSSDHGDMNSAHRLITKTAFYEESTRVPLIVCQPGITPGGTVTSRLVSNGLDIVPTFCDYAGIESPVNLEGMSLRPLAEGRRLESQRSFVPVENECGKMIITFRYKYMLHDSGKNREQFIDLQEDPGEMRNAVNDPTHLEVLQEHRRIFHNYFGSDRDRDAPHRAPLPHHHSYGSVSGGSAAQAGSSHGNNSPSE